MKGHSLMQINPFFQENKVFLIKTDLFSLWNTNQINISKNWEKVLAKNFCNTRSDFNFYLITTIYFFIYVSNKNHFIVNYSLFIKIIPAEFMLGYWLFLFWTKNTLLGKSGGKQPKLFKMKLGIKTNFDCHIHSFCFRLKISVLGKSCTKNQNSLFKMKVWNQTNWNVVCSMVMFFYLAFEKTYLEQIWFKNVKLSKMKLGL